MNEQTKPHNYYEAPTHPVWQHIRVNALMVWADYLKDVINKEYVREKFYRILNMENVKDNYMTIIAMFDLPNQGKLWKLLDTDVLVMLRDTFIDVQAMAQVGAINHALATRGALNA